MVIYKNLKIDFSQCGLHQQVSVVQGDCMSRGIIFSLYENGTPMELPDGVTPALRYGKSDGTGGVYDTLPDGSAAWSASGNTVSMILVPQVMTVPGLVRCQLMLANNDTILGSFAFHLIVEPDPAYAVVESKGYFNWSKVVGNLIMAPQAEVGQIIRVKAVDAQGNPTEWEAVDLPDSSQNVYIGADEPTGDNRPLYWLDTSEDETVTPEPDVPDEPDNPEVATYTITNTLTNVTNSNATTSVEENASYKATLTAADGYEISTVKVTMGGADVTSTVYSGGVVTISAVTGNVVITATATAASTESNIYKLADISVETTVGQDAPGGRREGYTRYKVENIQTGDIVRLAGVNGDNSRGWYDGTTTHSLNDTSWFTGEFQDNYSWKQYTWPADKDYEYLYFASSTTKLETYPNSAATIEKAVS